MFHLQLQIIFIWSLFVIISTTTMSTIIEYSTLETSSMKQTTENAAVQTYIILYDNAINKQNSINCSFHDLNAGMLQLWTAPIGVHLTLSDNNTRNSDGQMENFKESWVELATDNSLVFHNPDNSISGPYTCVTISNYTHIFQKTVWVNVLRKSFFDIKKRLKIALLTSGICLVIILCCYVCYWHKTKKTEYSLAKCNGDLSNIPKIKVICASRESLNSQDTNLEHISITKKPNKYSYAPANIDIL